MKKQNTVAIAIKGKDLRIKHFKALSSLPQQGFNDMREVLLFLQDFTGLTYNQLLNFTKKDIDAMALAAIKSCAEVGALIEARKGLLPQQIIIKQVNYLLVDPTKVGIGWHIDFGQCNINIDPVQMACLFYLPEGYNYSDVDQNGNITQPILNRYDIFAENFPLDLFVQASAFFLTRSLKLTSLMLQVETAKRVTQKKINWVINKLRRKSGRVQ
jgi:hypothetical protein